MQIYNTTLPEALAYKQKSFYKKKNRGKYTNSRVQTRVVIPQKFKSMPSAAGFSSRRNYKYLQYKLTHGEASTSKLQKLNIYQFSFAIHEPSPIFS